ncbi:Protein of unknown function [Bacillus cereus]|nr:Protein of unknown function [Bacillus cereus]
MRNFNASFQLHHHT